MPTLSYSQIISRFPEFITNDLIKQSTIESVAIAASLEIDPITWGALAEEGLYWLTASKLAIAEINKTIFDAKNISGNLGLSNAKKIDINQEVSVEFNDLVPLVGKLMSNDANRKNTYLIEYERLLSLVSDGIFYSFE